MLQPFDQDRGIISNDWDWLLNIQIPFPDDVCVLPWKSRYGMLSVVSYISMKMFMYCHLSSGPSWMSYGQIGLSKNISILQVIVMLLKKPYCVSQNCLSLKEPLKVIWFNFPSVNRDIYSLISLIPQCAGKLFLTTW